VVAAACIRLDIRWQRRPVRMQDPSPSFSVLAPYNYVQVAHGR
jgi:hypothetical protein